jgi:hypothetical protein
MMLFWLQLSVRFRHRQRQLSDLLHQSGDAYARSHGWTIIRTTGLFGFDGRRYHDPRLNKYLGNFAAAQTDGH